MFPPGRITLTKKEAESPEGWRLLNMILSSCHDGNLTINEVQDMHTFVCRTKTSIRAFEVLRLITREIVYDANVDRYEAYNLKVAFQRIAPKEIRGVIETHLEEVGTPSRDPDEPIPRWHREPATQAQLEYIIGLGGSARSGMKKGEASMLIESLLQKRPPTPRQVMLLRFFDKTVAQSKTKDEVGVLIDTLLCEDDRYEMAWQRFKRVTNHDPFDQDPSIVPVGAYRDYLQPLGPM